MPRAFELREKGSGSGANTIMTADSLDELVEKLGEKTGRGGELDPRLDGGK